MTTKPFTDPDLDMYSDGSPIRDQNKTAVIEFGIHDFPSIRMSQTHLKIMYIQMQISFNIQRKLAKFMYPNKIQCLNIPIQEQNKGKQI